jgi:hypothetical protein
MEGAKINVWQVSSGRKLRVKDESERKEKEKTKLTGQFWSVSMKMVDNVFLLERGEPLACGGPIREKEPHPDSQENGDEAFEDEKNLPSVDCRTVGEADSVREHSAKSPTTGIGLWQRVSVLARKGGDREYSRRKAREFEERVPKDGTSTTSEPEQR